MPEFTLTSPIGAHAVPHTFWAGSNTGTLQNLQLPANSGQVRLVLGIDVYATNQPANGEISLVYMDHLYFPSGYVVLQLQQSQNFPGPFYWRGLFPVYDTAGLLQWNGFVPFSFVMWGVRVPDWQVDMGQVNP